MKTLVIVGASRGLGAAFNLGLPEPGDRLWLISRGEPQHVGTHAGVERRWIAADLAQAGAAQQIAQAIDGQRVDALIYNAGIWEASGFEAVYDFERIRPAETERILTVNLTAAIACVQALLPNLRQSDNPKIVLIGSISGLENNGSVEVAYDASKFGLRGLAHALRENLRRDGMGVTVINPGSIATEVPFERGRAAALAGSGLASLPMHDLVDLVKCVINLSRAACVKEIDVPATGDEGV